MNQLTCRKCNNVFPATTDYFYPHSQCRFGVNATCKPCARRISRNRDKQAKRNTRLRMEYNLSPEAYQSMLDTQKGRCAICKKPEPRKGWNLAVDHCHNTGRIRGLLCHLCNTAIGKLNDDPALLQRAAEYLQEQF